MIALGATRKLRTLLTRVEQQFNAAAANPENAEAIHGLRTGARRLAQALTLFEAGNRAMRRRLKKVGRACGSLRDLDVIFEVLRSARAGRSRRFQEDLKGHRAEALHKLTRKLRRWKRRRIFEGWRKSLRARRSRQAVCQHVARLMRDFFEQGDRAAERGRSYREIHRFRILAKKLRYALELTEPPNSSKLGLMRGLQDHLGALNDCVVAAGIVSGVRTATPEEVHRIRALLPRRERAFRAYWSATFLETIRTLWMKDYT